MCVLILTRLSHISPSICEEIIIYPICAPLLLTILRSSSEPSPHHDSSNTAKIESPLLSPLDKFLSDIGDDMENIEIRDDKMMTYLLAINAIQLRNRDKHDMNISFIYDKYLSNHQLKSKHKDDIHITTISSSSSSSSSSSNPSMITIEDATIQASIELLHSILTICPIQQAIIDVLDRCRVSYSMLSIYCFALMHKKNLEDNLNK